MKKDLEYFGNDKYRLLKLIYDRKVLTGGEETARMSQIEIADEIKLSKSNVNGLLKKLIEKKYIKIPTYKDKKNKEKKQNARYTITLKGKRVIEAFKDEN